MPKRSKGPWKRKTGGWWCWSEGRQVRLGESKAEAWRQWHLLQAGERVDEGAVLFRTVADRYVQALKRSRSARHAKGTRERLDAFVQPWWHRATESLGWVDVESVLASKKWNPTTQGNHLTALRGCLRWATKVRMIDDNPIPHISIPRAETRKGSLTAAQVKAIVDRPGPLQHLLWALSVTGARPGELIGATTDQCDDDGTAIRLPKSKVGRRIVWFAQQDRARMAAYKATVKPGPLFPAPRGDHWNKRSFHEAFKATREAAKLPDWVTAYLLRHFWITERLRGEKRMSMEDVATLAGTSVTMIRRTYSHLTDEDVKDIADRL